MPISLPYRPHPWHGLSPGDRFPEIVTAYVEIVPSDGVKYEMVREDPRRVRHVLRVADNGRAGDHALIAAPAVRRRGPITASPRADPLDVALGLAKMKPLFAPRGGQSVGGLRR